MDKLKNQLTAAVAMSAAALIASGYAITWMRLDRVEAPPRAVLPALSTGYYLGVALEALLFLLLFLLTVGFVFLLAQIRPGSSRTTSGWPGTGAWLGLGLVVAVSGVVYGGAPTSGVFSGGVEPAYPLVLTALGFGAVLFALAIGRAGKLLRLKGPIAISAAVLILCTAAAVGFKVADARFGAIAFPQAAALTPQADCHTPDAVQVPRGCGFGGFYVGEDSNWIYFVQTPLVCPGIAKQPGRLLQVRRDEPYDVIVSEHLPTKPLKCSAGVHHVGPVEPERKEEPGDGDADKSKGRNGRTKPHGGRQPDSDHPGGAKAKSTAHDDGDAPGSSHEHGGGHTGHGTQRTKPPTRDNPPPDKGEGNQRGPAPMPERD